MSNVKHLEIILNIRGIYCPETIMMVRKTLREMIEGQKLLIISDDPSTKRDIPLFCIFMQHTLLHQDSTNIPYRYVLCKGL